MNESREPQRVEVCTVRGRDQKAGTLRLYITRQIKDRNGNLLEEFGRFKIEYDEPADAESLPVISMQSDTLPESPEF